jgi:hypothetical protein
LEKIISAMSFPSHRMKLMIKDHKAYFFKYKTQ